MTTKTMSKAKLAREMAGHYLRNNDIEIVEKDFKCDEGRMAYVCRENGSLVFINVKCERGDSFTGDYVSPAKRSEFEQVAIKYLTIHETASCRVRFDIIAVKLTGEQQCLLRHHRDWFAAEA